AVNVVFGQLVELLALHQAVIVKALGGSQFQLLAFAIARDGELHGITNVMHVDGVLVISAHVFANLDGTVGRYLVAVHFQQYVVVLQYAPGGSVLEDLGDQNAAVVRRNGEGFAHRGAFQALAAKAKVGNAVMNAIGRVCKHVLDHSGRNEIALILRTAAKVCLHDHADDLAVDNHRAAAVAGIDGRIDLARQQKAAVVRIVRSEEHTS